MLVAAPIIAPIIVLKVIVILAPQNSALNFAAHVYLLTRIDMKGKKTGGRQKGTPNKITAMCRELMAHWLSLHASKLTPKAKTELIWQDFASLDPRDRIRVTLEFIKLSTPRQLNVDTTSASPIELRLMQFADNEDGEEADEEECEEE